MADAFRILSNHLLDMSGIDLETVKATHGASNAGSYLVAKAEVSVAKAQTSQEKGWNTIRDWFEELSEEVMP